MLSIQLSATCYSSKNGPLSRYDGIHKEEAARDRIRMIAEKTRCGQGNTSAEQHIRWDQNRGLLIDYVTESEYTKFLQGESSSCRQYTFKLAVLVYACERLGLKREFPKELELMHEQLSAAQLSSGGVSRFYDVDLSKKRISKCL